MIQQAAHGTLGGRIYDAARLAQTTTVDYLTKGAYNPGSSGEIAGMVGGIAAGLAIGALLGPSIAGGAAAVAAGMIAGWFAEALIDTINEQYPNLGADFQSWLGDLQNSIQDAASSAWGAAQDGWNDATGAASDWWQNLSWGDLNGNGEPDWMNFPDPGSLLTDPLVIDLNGDGVTLLGADQSAAHFDYAGDGFREKTGWAAGGDGILVRDLNGDGLIETMPELLASATQNVFQVLKTFDTNNDNKINASDSGIWSSLKVWVDSDGDGITDAGELKTLSSLGITEISLSSSTTALWANGNHIDATSTVTMNGVLQQAQAVYFGTQANNAVFVAPQGFVLNDEVRVLPNLSGGGGVPPLRYIMTLDAGLRTEVRTLVETAGNLTYAQLRVAVEAMILNWSGADNAVAGSRGIHIDARHAAAVEAFGGSTTVTSIHAPPAAIMESLYQKLVDDFTIRFAAQSYVSAISLAAQQTVPNFPADHNYSFLNSIGFDSKTNALSLNCGAFALSVIESIQATGGDALTILKSGTYTSAMTQSFIAVNALIDKNPSEFIQSTRWSRDDISSLLSEDDLAAAKIVQFLMAGGAIADVKAGTAAAETLTFDTTDIFGLGAAGNDAIQGNTLANVIFGGQGNDALNGDNGSDTYIYNNGDGADTITELANKGTADKLQIAGHSLVELKVAQSATNANDLVLTFTNNADQITLVGSAASAVVGTGVESFVLSGGVTKTLAEIYQIAINQQQTAGADVIQGFNSGADTITGGLGDDSLNGEDGNDTYVYNNGDGADTITELANKGAADKLQIAGHSLAQLKVARSATNANDLVLTFNNNTDKITLVGAAASAVVGTGVESFELSGGVIKTLAEIYQIAVDQQQTTGADTVRGFNSAADTITGGLGNDTLNGEDGNDTYVYNNGDGADTITELANNGTADKLQIAGHSLAQLKVARSTTNANDLVLTFTNNTDKITLVGAAASAVVGTGVESFVLSGGVTKTLAEVYQSAVNQQQTTGADTVRGFNSAADTITGGLGNDALNGEDGNDTYIYNNGDGADTITELANKGTGDTLQMAGHSLAQLKVARSATNANDLVLNFTNNTDKITLVGAAASGAVGTGMENFVFSGGVTKTRADVYQIAVNQQQTAGADTILGFASGNDLIMGGLGNDTMSGKGSNDTFVFAPGFGKDVITDFAAGAAVDDVLRLTLGTNFDTFAEVMAVALQVGVNTVINITANDTITLNGVTKTNLVANDFEFI
jgi:Ca2+-binding RTX toxin-like protein